MSTPNGNGLMKFWPLVVALFGIAVTWATLTMRVQGSEEDINENQVRIERLESSISDIKIALAKIEAAQTNSSADLERLRVEQARLTEALNQLLRELREAR